MNFQNKYKKFITVGCYANVWCAFSSGEEEEVIYINNKENDKIEQNSIFIWSYLVLFFLLRNGIFEGDLLCMYISRKKETPYNLFINIMKT